MSNKTGGKPIPPGNLWWCD